MDSNQSVRCGNEILTQSMSRAQKRRLASKLAALPPRYKATVNEHARLVADGRLGLRAWISHYWLDRQLGLPRKKCWELAFKYLDITRLEKGKHE